MLVAPYNWHAINILLHLAPFLLNIWLPHQSMMIHIVLPHSFFFFFLGTAAEVHSEFSRFSVK